MKKEKIEELFESNSSDLFDVDKVEYIKKLDLEDFTQAINQAELEWYKKLNIKLYSTVRFENPTFTHDRMIIYQNEIQNKIKELEK